MFPAESVEKLESWMKDRFPDCHVESGHASYSRTMIFRATAEDGTSYDLAITEQAIESHPPDTVVGDLDDQDVAERLRQDPTLRLCYYKNRNVPGFESWIIKCDGLQYRIVRDSDHNVAIYDGSDNPLANRPDNMLVLPTSIFRRPKDRWCSHIEKWRGDDQ